MQLNCVYMIIYVYTMYNLSCISTNSGSITPQKCLTKGIHHPFEDRPGDLALGLRKADCRLGAESKSWVKKLSPGGYFGGSPHA